MSILSKISNLILHLENRNRQTGRTTAIIEAVKRTPNAVFVTHSHDFAEQIKKTM